MQVAIEQGDKVKLARFNELLDGLTQFIQNTNANRANPLSRAPAFNPPATLDNPQWCFALY